MDAGYPIDPLGDEPLSNADGERQLVLAPHDLNSALDGFHILDISAAAIWRQQRRCWSGPLNSISVANMVRDDAQRRAKPTPSDLLAAERLRRIWRAQRESGIGPTQDTLGAALEEEWGRRSGQSTVSQYINGGIPLNAAAVLFFARHLGCKPEAIRQLSEVEPELRYWSLVPGVTIPQHAPAADSGGQVDGHRKTPGIKEPKLIRRRTGSKQRA